MRTGLVVATLVAVSALAGCNGSDKQQGGATDCGSLYNQFQHDYFAEHASLPPESRVEAWREASGCR